MTSASNRFQPSGFTELNDLADISITSPADKHLLIYDGVTNNTFESRLFVEADISDLQSYSLTGHTHVLADVTDSGTAAALNVGTAANEIVQLDGTAKLPAVDGSALTGLAEGRVTETFLTVSNDDYQSTSGERIFADTSGGAFTVKLPASPATQAKVIFVPDEDFTTNNLRVSSGTSTLEGAAGDRILILNENVTHTLIYIGGTWRVFLSDRDIVGSGTAVDNFQTNATVWSFDVTKKTSKIVTALNDTRAYYDQNTNSLNENGQIVGTAPKSTGKYYMEYVVYAAGSRGTSWRAAFCLGHAATVDASQDWLSSTGTGALARPGCYGAHVYTSSGTRIVNGADSTTFSDPGADFEWFNGARWWMAADLDTGKIWIGGNNGYTIGGGDPDAGTTPTMTIDAEQIGDPFYIVVNTIYSGTRYNDPGFTVYTEPADHTLTGNQNVASFGKWLAVDATFEDRYNLTYPTTEVLTNRSIGTGIGDIFVLEDVAASAGLPAVDGSQLTGVPVGSHVHDTADITTGTFADALVAASNVTQHQAALSITESQVSDLQSYLLDTTDTFTGVLTVTGSAAIDNITVDGNVISSTDVNGNITLTPNGTGEVIISSNLTVSGTTTTVNSNEVNIADNIIVLNSDEAGTPSADAGLEIERGTSTNARFLFEESTDLWKSDPGTGTLSEVLTTLSTLDDLSDITITTIAAGEILKWDGTNWINNTLAEAGVAADSHTHALDDTTDVDLTTTAPVTDDALVYDGANWVPGSVGSALITKDEGSNLSTATASIDFVGSGVTATTSGDDVTVTIPGPAGSSPGFKGANAYATSIQTIPNSTWTAINLDSEEYDTNDYHDNVTNNSRITIPESGYYLVTGYFRLASYNGARMYAIQFYVNGSSISSTHQEYLSENTNQQTVESTQVLKLDAGDYVELYAYQSSGGNLDTLASAATQYPRLTLTKIETAVVGGGFSGAKSDISTTQNYPNASAGKAKYKNSLYDTDNYYQGVDTDQMILPANGYYLINGYAASNGAENPVMYLYHNATLIGETRDMGAGESANIRLSAAQVFYGEAGDTVEMRLYHTTAAGTTFTNGSFSVSRLSGDSSAFSGASVYRNTTQTLTNGTFTTIQFNAEEYDTDTFHDNATNNTRLTVPSTGYYLLSGKLSYDANATGQRRLAFIVNGGTDYYGQAVSENTGGSIPADVTTTHVINLTAGDYVEMVGHQNSGGNLDVRGGNTSQYARFHLTKLTGAVVSNLDGLGDTVITSNTSGEILKWDGTNWINNTLAEAGIAADSHVHDTADVTTGTFADARIAATNVTQHQAALSITESQVSDLQAYMLDTTDTFTGVLTVTGSAAIDNITIDTNSITATDTNGNLLLVSDGTGTVQANGSRVLTTADEGTGNGIDADTLDGSHASDFSQVNWIVKTTTYTAVSGDKILTDSTSAAFTITLPTSPAVGDEVRFLDASGTCGTNTVTIAVATGDKLLGVTDDTYLLDVNDERVRLVYFNATRGWVVEV
jgi:hypothetical protein